MGGLGFRFRLTFYAAAGGTLVSAADRDRQSVNRISFGSGLGYSERGGTLSLDENKNGSGLSGSTERLHDFRNGARQAQI